MSQSLANIVVQAACVVLVVSPLQGLLPFDDLTQGFTLGCHIAPLQG